MNNKIVFRYGYWKSITVLLPSIFLLLACSLLIFIGINLKDSTTIYLGGGLLAYFSCIWFYLFGTKIEMNDKGIKYSSILKTIFIEWKNIKSIGGYIPSEFMNIEMDLRFVSKFNFWGQKFLFVSTEETKNVKWGQRVTNKFICFHYTIINQALQVVQFKILGLGLFYVSGFYLVIGVIQKETFQFYSDWSSFLVACYVYINRHENFLLFFNLPPLIIIYLIHRLFSLKPKSPDKYLSGDWQY